MNVLLLVYYQRLLKQAGFIPCKIWTYLTQCRLFSLAFVAHILQRHMYRIAREAKLPLNMEW